jgi:hypothetical protein
VKLLADPDLPGPYARAARRTLAAKSAIYAQGCDRRGRQTEAAWYRNLSRAAGLAPGPMVAPLADAWLNLIPTGGVQRDNLLQQENPV